VSVLGVGSRCPVCHRRIKAGELEPRYGAVGKLAAMAHVTPRSSHTISNVQNSVDAAALEPRRRRSPRSKTRRPSRKGIGGRPLAFIPALVVAEAARLAALGIRWASILEGLERGGNGRYARNTLIRRVAKYSAGQNSAVDTGGRGRRRAPRARSKTRRPDWSAEESGLVNVYDE
jgi:hypothetical protein